MVENTKKFLAPFHNKNFDAPPIWLMRQAGRYLPEYRALRQSQPDFITFCLTPELTIEAALQPLRRFDLDAAIVFCDILVVPHALGQRVTFVEKEGPLLDLFEPTLFMRAYDKTAFLSVLNPVFESLKGLRQTLPPDKGIIGFAGGPWTVAAYMIEGKITRDLRRIKAFGYADEKGLNDFLMFLAQTTADYLCAQADAGAEVLQIFESWAGFVPPTYLKSWFIDPLSLIAQRLKDHCPQVPCILYTRGAGALWVQIFDSLDFQGWAVDQSVNLKQVIQKISTSPHRVLQTGIDSLWLTLDSPTFDKEVTQILDLAGKIPFIFNVAQGLYPETKPANITRLLSIIKEKYP